MVNKPKSLPFLKQLRIGDIQYTQWSQCLSAVALILWCNLSPLTSCCKSLHALEIFCQIHSLKIKCNVKCNLLIRMGTILQKLVPMPKNQKLKNLSQSIFLETPLPNKLTKFLTDFCPSLGSKKNKKNNTHYFSN